MKARVAIDCLTLQSTIFASTSNASARALPAGVDFWDFDCKLGVDQSVAAVLHFAALITEVDALAKGGAEQFYVEIVTKYGYRAARPAAEQPELTADH